MQPNSPKYREACGSAKIMSSKNPVPEGMAFTGARDSRAYGVYSMVQEV